MTSRKLRTRAGVLLIRRVIRDLHGVAQLGPPERELTSRAARMTAKGQRPPLGRLNTVFPGKPAVAVDIGGHSADQRAEHLLCSLQTLISRGQAGPQTGQDRWCSGLDVLLGVQVDKHDPGGVQVSKSTADRAAAQVG
jgi:hypothetical protein